MAISETKIDYLQTTFIPVSRYVKIIEIQQEFQELCSQMYGHVFYESQ